MSIDLLIPFKHSRWNDLEIKYALRGVEKHLKGVGRVFIVGDYPRSITKGFIHLPYEDDPERVYKERNIFDKVIYAMVRESLSRVLFMNDDHFLLKDYEASAFPNYYGDWPFKSDMYAQTIANSKPYAKEFYDVHCPMILEKKRFIEKVGTLDWRVKAGYCMKSVYASGLEGEYYRDLKIRLQAPIGELRKKIEGGYWFSMCDMARGEDMLRLLNELYPKPSRFETTKKMTTA